MGYVLLFCLVVTILFLILAYWANKFHLKEKEDHEFHMKAEKWRKRINPFVHFFENAFWWVMAFYVIYLIWG